MENENRLDGRAVVLLFSPYEDYPRNGCNEDDFWDTEFETIDQDGDGEPDKGAGEVNG